MRPIAGLSVAVAAALVWTGLGAGSSVAYAATGVFGYTHTSDKKHRAVSDPETGSCIDIDEQAYEAVNGTNRSVTLYKSGDCEGESMTLAAGQQDSTRFKFRGVHFN